MKVNKIHQSFQLCFLDHFSHQFKINYFICDYSLGTQIKEFLNSLVTRNDLDAVLDKINNNATSNSQSGIPDTAAGTFKMRCLLCGRAANGVTGMIAASEVARLLGTPPNSLPKKAVNRNSFDLRSSSLIGGNVVT